MLMYKKVEGIKYTSQILTPSLLGHNFTKLTNLLTACLPSCIKSANNSRLDLKMRPTTEGVMRRPSTKGGRKRIHTEERSIRKSYKENYNRLF